MKKLFNEFRAFAIRGNVIDMAVGIVIGGAFGALVNGIVTGIINPIVAFMTPGKETGDLTHIIKGIENFGLGLFNFILLAAVVFFVFVKPMNKLKEAMASKDENPEETPLTTEEILLTEIRDLLKNKTQS